MKKSRFTEEQIIGLLKQAEAGMPIKELCRNGGFSDATFYKWREQYPGFCEAGLGYTLKFSWVARVVPSNHCHVFCKRLMTS